MRVTLRAVPSPPGAPLGLPRAAVQAAPALSAALQRGGDAGAPCQGAPLRPPPAAGLRASRTSKDSHRSAAGCGGCAWLAGANAAQNHHDSPHSLTETCATQ